MSRSDKIAAKSQRRLKCFATTCVRIARVATTPGLTTYFFWMAVFYLSTGIFCLLSLPDDFKHLCTIEASLNYGPANEDGSMVFRQPLDDDVACGGCRDSLLLCGKASKCWQYAVNLTLMVFDPTLKTQSATFETAAADLVCNDVVATSDDPVEMLDQLFKLAAEHVSYIEVTTACISFHCNVLENAYNVMWGGTSKGKKGIVSAVQSDLISTGGECTNTFGMKPASESSSCPCDSLTMLSKQSANFEELCVTQNVKFQRSLFIRELLHAPPCLQLAILDQETEYADIMQGFIHADNCTQYLAGTETAQEWFLQISDSLYQHEVLGEAISVPLYCKKIMCQAFADTLPLIDGTPYKNEVQKASASRCSWEEGLLAAVTMEQLTAVAKMCASFVYLRLQTAGAIAKKICENVKKPANLEICNLTATPAPTVGDAIRRLTPNVAPPERRSAPQEEQASAGAPEVRRQASTKKQGATVGAAATRRCEGGRCLAAPLPAASRRPASPTSAAPTDSAARAAQAAQPASLTRWPGARRRPAAKGEARRGPKVSGGELAGAPEAARRLQVVQTAYTYTAWSQCTCYQQCVSGVQTRSVTCPTGVKCSGTEPAAAQSCKCWHCAKCNSYYVILVFALGYGVQGIIGALLWIAFWMVSQFDEEDWSGVGICTKILGFWCKFLPGAVRFFTFFTFIILAVILYMAFIPGFRQSDCKAARFQAIAIVVAFVWLLQLFFGVIMSRRQPMPPWLHNSSQNKTIRAMCRPCRSIGP